VEAAAYPSGGADWIIVETPRQQPERVIEDAFGHRFSHSGWYPGGRLSGTTWHLYRNSQPSTARLLTTR